MAKWAIDQLDAITNRNSTHDLDCQAADDCMTEQSDLKDSDINNIVERFKQTGALDPWMVKSSAPVYGDFTQYQDYQSNLNTVIQAQDAFDSLPAGLRKRFDNDPVELMKFLSDVKNKDEAISLGLVKAPPAAPPASADQTAAPPAKSV